MNRFTFSSLRRLVVDCLIGSLAMAVQLEFPSLDQLVDIVVRGEHRRLLWIFETGALFVRLLTALSILAVSSGSHVLEESQNLHVVRRRLSQFVQLSASGKKE